MASDLGVSDIASATGLVGLLALVGAGIKWMWSTFSGRIDKRQADIDAQGSRYATERDVRITTLEVKVETLGGRINDLLERNASRGTAIHLLVAKVAADDPRSPVLQQVQRLLGSDYPGFFGLVPTPPGDLARLVREADQALDARKETGDDG